MTDHFEFKILVPSTFLVKQVSIPIVYIQMYCLYVYLQNVCIWRGESTDVFIVFTVV